MGDYRSSGRSSAAPRSADVRETVIVNLALANLRDLTQCFPSLASDVQRCASRVRAEGAGFCTKVLPQVGRYLDAVLIGGVRQEAPAGTKGHGMRINVFPAFFSHLAPLDHCGQLDVEWACENVDQIRELRLFFRLFSKLEDETTMPEAVQCRFAQEWANRVTRCCPSEGFLESDICKDATAFVTSLFPSDTEQAVVEAAFSLCRNGPGVVVERLRGNDKWDFIPTQRVLNSGLGSLLRLNERHENDVPLTPLHGDGCTRMILVPKDFRGPRIISCEPAALQFLQQGLMRSLVSHLEKVSHELHFTDQKVNQRLAWEGSRAHLSEDGTTNRMYRSFATIDMKDASDLVSHPLVNALFSGVPCILDWMNSTRSTLSETPVGVIPLKCFAPMGSALCFPVEAIVFWALAKAATKSTGIARYASSEVHVFGDDIIVHPAYVADLKKVYASAGLTVNLSKTCFKTPFRESCGADWFNGVGIATPRLRRLSGRPDSLT